MRIYDISRELFSAQVYPGDCPPQLIADTRMEQGAACNCSTLHMSAHAATHCDAPRHFIRDGADTADVSLRPFIGPCAVVTGPEHAKLGAAFFRGHTPAGTKRLLLRCGTDTHLTEDAAEYLAGSGLLCLGTEATSVGAPGGELVHVPLLRAGVCLVEQLWLRSVPDGHYFLSAAPLKIAGCDGAPCRAVLLDFETEALQ